MIPSDKFTTEESLDYALSWVTNAFIIHQTATYSRPIYRHTFGDIRLIFIGLSGLIGGFLESAGKTPTQSGNFLLELIDWEKWEEMKDRHTGFLYCMGSIPELTEFGLKWIACQLDQLGDMIQSLGLETALKLMSEEVAQ